MVFRYSGESRNPVFSKAYKHPGLRFSPVTTFYETIVAVNFCEIINVSGYQKEEGIIWMHVHGAVSLFWMRRTPIK
jgi:hypothetical protein